MDAIIILKGRASIGKSETLNRLIELLASSPNSQLLEPSNFKDTNNNFGVIQYNNRRIGVITFGDPGCEDAVRDRLTTCDNFNCDIVVAASRTYGAINNILWEYAESHSAQGIQTEPLYSYDYAAQSHIDTSAINNFAAENIQRLIDFLLSQNQK